jgi:hypothetical protein
MTHRKSGKCRCGPPREQFPALLAEFAKRFAS